MTLNFWVCKRSSTPNNKVRVGNNIKQIALGQKSQHCRDLAQAPNLKSIQNIKIAE